MRHWPHFLDGHRLPRLYRAASIARVHAPGGGTTLDLPQPLPPSDAALIQDIFALQRQGRFPQAAAATTRLADHTLLPAILADRFLARPARSSTAELKSVLTRYADLPDAPAIYALLLKRTPRGMAPPPAPGGGSLAAPTAAETDEAAVAPARAALSAGQNKKAWRLGRAAWLRSGHRDGQAAFVTGLADWRREGFAHAALWFEAAATVPDAGPGLRAAASFWAARAHQRAGDNPAIWRALMQRAASEPLALHGMLARRLLGQPEVPQLPGGVMTEADIDAIDALPGGRRAFALLQVGQPARAEAELRHLWPEARRTPEMARALLMVAADAGLDSLQADLASVLHVAGAEPRLPRLHPSGGFVLNPALVYAVTRVESGFSAQAVSPAGAVGLMQLMPNTASAMNLRGGRSLTDAGNNLRLGQRFLAYLSREDMAGDDLLRVLASYNAGAGAAHGFNVSGETDPLLYLEMLPIEETRHYVQSTLTYLGLYAARLRRPAPALDSLAAGLWPRFSDEVQPTEVALAH